MSAHLEPGGRWQAWAPGKVNLSLLLGPTRADGRHELVTVFESLSLADRVTLTTLPGSAVVEDEVVCPGVEGPNLAGAALAELRRHGWAAPPVRLEIDKRVPVAAGMGGGSADAGAALRLAAALCRYPEGFDLDRMAAALGADVPAQLKPGLTLGTGAGDVVEPLSPLAAHALVIVPAEASLSTASVYAEADRLGLGRSGSEMESAAGRLRAHPPGALLAGDLLVNDLQPAALSLLPVLAGTLAEISRAGADQVLVCGSGPTVAGVYWGAPERAQQAVRKLRAHLPRAAVALGVGAAFAAPRSDGNLPVGHNPG